MRMNRAAGSDDELLAETASRGLGGGGAAALRGTGTIVQSSSAPRGVVLAVHNPAAAPVAMGEVVDVAEPDATRAGDATSPLYKGGLGLLFLLAGLSFGMALAAFAQQSALIYVDCSNAESLSCDRPPTWSDAEARQVQCVEILDINYERITLWIPLADGSYQNEGELDEDGSFSIRWAFLQELLEMSSDDRKESAAKSRQDEDDNFAHADYSAKNDRFFNASMGFYDFDSFSQSDDVYVISTCWALGFAAFITGVIGTFFFQTVRGLVLCGCMCKRSLCIHRGFDVAGVLYWLVILILIAIALSYVKDADDFMQDMDQWQARYPPACTIEKYVTAPGATGFYAASLVCNALLIWGEAAHLRSGPHRRINL